MYPLAGPAVPPLGWADYDTFRITAWRTGYDTFRTTALVDWVIGVGRAAGR